MHMFSGSKEECIHRGLRTALEALDLLAAGSGHEPPSRFRGSLESSAAPAEAVIEVRGAGAASARLEETGRSASLALLREQACGADASRAEPGYSRSLWRELTPACAGPRDVRDKARSVSESAALRALVDQACGQTMGYPATVNN